MLTLSTGDPLDLAVGFVIMCPAIVSGGQKHVGYSTFEVGYVSSIDKSEDKASRVLAFVRDAWF